MTNASGLNRDGRTAYFPQEPYAILAPAEVTNLAPPEGNSQTTTIRILVLWHKLAFAVWKGWSKLLTEDIQRTNMIKGTSPNTDKSSLEGLHPKPNTVNGISGRKLFDSNFLYIQINYLDRRKFVPLNILIPIYTPKSYLFWPMNYVKSKSSSKHYRWLL